MLIGMIGITQGNKNISTIQDGDGIVFKKSRFVYVDVCGKEYFLSGSYIVDRVLISDSGDVLSVEVVSEDGNIYNLDARYLELAEKKSKLYVFDK